MGIAFSWNQMLKSSEDYDLWSADNLFSLVHFKIEKNKEQFWKFKPGFQIQGFRYNTESGMYVLYLFSHHDN